MNRDEFMELAYETFADEPDNVLANGIIEAADAYVEHEKAQLSKEGTTISRQWLLECVDEGWIKFDTEEDANRFIHLVRDIAPGVQSVATDTNVGDTISRQAAIDEVMKYGTIWMEYNDAMSKDEIAQIALNNAKSTMIRILKDIQPEPKEGHWIRRDCGLDVECKCSKCGYRDFVEPGDEYWFNRNFCPNCGTKMKGEPNEAY